MRKLAIVAAVMLVVAIFSFTLLPAPTSIRKRMVRDYGGETLICDCENYRKCDAALTCVHSSEQTDFCSVCTSYDGNGGQWTFTVCGDTCTE